MKKTLIIMVLVVTLSSCASSQQAYQNKLSSYNQNPEYKVIADFGQPHKTYQIDSTTKVISYYRKNFNPVIAPKVGLKVESEDLNIDTIAPTLIFNGARYAHGLIDSDVGENVFYDNCSTNFTIQNGYVIESDFSGNSCGK